MSEKHIFTIFLFLTGVSIQAQQNYLAFDYSLFQFKHSSSAKTIGELSEKLNRCEGTHTGASYHLAFGRRNSLSIGMGLSNISYQKQWMGTFSGSSAFGVVTVNGRINYWSFPISYTQSIASSRSNYCYRSGRRERFRFGFSITYTPSFEGRNSFSVNASGGADLHSFLTGYNSNQQSFQHSLTLGLCDQLFLFEKHLRLEVEPYAGIGSGYFKESGTNINNVSFGLRLRIGLYAKLPRISIEKEVDKGNAEEKKKQLEQKQKEIEEQLKNRNPK
jgi:hypothetical protein